MKQVKTCIEQRQKDILVIGKPLVTVQHQRDGPIPSVTHMIFFQKDCAARIWVAGPRNCRMLSATQALVSIEIPPSHNQSRIFKWPRQTAYVFAISGK